MLHLLCLLVLGAPAARALSWDECLREAGRAHPRLAAASAAVEGARAGRSAAREGYGPTISVGASESRTQSSGLSSPASVSVGPRASWNVFSGFETRAAVRSASAELARSESARAAEDASVRAELRRAFGRLLSAQETVELSEKIDERLQTNAQFIRLRYEGGVEARWGHLKAQADAKDAAWDHKRATLDLRSAQKALGDALGRTRFEALRAEGKLDVSGPGALDDALAGLERHPSIRRQRDAVDAARARITTAQAQRRPSLDLSGGYSRLGSDWGLPEDDWSVSASASWRLYPTSMNTVSERRRALEAEEARLVEARNDAAGRVESAYARYRAATDRLEVAAAQLDASRERAETVQALYGNGRASFLEWDESQASYTRSQRAELSTRLEAYLALADWEEALGTGTAEP